MWIWSKIDLGVEALGVLLEARHQLRPLDAVGVRRPVVDVGGRHQLAALREAGDQHGLEVGARGVYCRRISGGAGTQDQQAGVLGRTSRFLALQNELDCNRSAGRVPCEPRPRRRAAATAPRRDARSVYNAPSEVICGKLMFFNRKEAANRAAPDAAARPPPAQRRLSPRFARLVRESWWLLVVAASSGSR